MTLERTVWLQERRRLTAERYDQLAPDYDRDWAPSTRHTLRCCSYCWHDSPRGVACSTRPAAQANTGANAGARLRSRRHRPVGGHAAARL
ncbi:MAG: hypothetical protein IRZ31_10695 [Thermogemmatispora sp.]|nr:hypothetical protein [Thermogemmatispora sp.]